MIRIYAWRREEGIELLAYGHAEYGVAGQDIVCAGVSALLYGLKAYLERQSLLCEGCHMDAAEWGGGLRLRTEGFDGSDKQAWEVIRVGIELISCAYPQYVYWEEEDSCQTDALRLLLPRGEDNHQATAISERKEAFNEDESYGHGNGT